MNAPLDSGDTFSVGVCGGVPNQNPDAGTVGACLVHGHRCTGTLIAPNLVLTARHCVDEPVFTNSNFCQNTWAGNLSPTSVTLSSSTIEGSPQWLDVREIRVPAGNNNCDDDMALLVLASNVPSSAARPASVDVDRDIALAPPSSITIVGRGAISEYFDADAGTDTVDQAGLERRILRHIPFVCASDTSGTCVVTDTSSPPSNTFALPKSLVQFGPAGAPGDSGSGFLEQCSYAAGKPVVLGVNTLGTYGFDGHPDATIGVRASFQKDFLVTGAHHAASIGGYPVPSWASDDERVPETVGGNNLIWD
ncbi:MAG TPA: trypsin-like serine protease [Polyangiaceae bacterium]|nr:trypsin-like serine protease [Polyangiaceae bacterium]